MLNRREVLCAVPAAILSQMPELKNRDAKDATISEDELIQYGNRLMADISEREQRVGDVTIRNVATFAESPKNHHISGGQSSEKDYAGGWTGRLGRANSAGEFFVMCSAIAHRAASVVNNLVENTRAQNPGRPITLVLIDSKMHPYITSLKIIDDGSIEFSGICDFGVYPS